MTDLELMKRALELAKKGVGAVSLNPPVGAVIAEGGKIIGEGYHRKFGGPHAEVWAIRDAKKSFQGRLKSATIYVTLEPCAHHGKTPPCVDLLISEGIARVVVAMKDPNPLVAGRSIKKLRAAGVHVDVGILESSAKDLAKTFVKNVRTGLPFVTLKLALSVDGKLTGVGGAPVKITSLRQDHAVHRLRGEADAILVGIGTVLSDDPMLTVRYGLRKGKPLMRIVLDSELRIPLTSRLVGTASDTPVHIFTSKDADKKKISALRDRGVTVTAVGHKRGQLDIEAVLKELFKMNIGHLLVEGGDEVARSFLQLGLVDEALLFYGRQALPEGKKSVWPTLVQAPVIPGMKLVAELKPIRCFRFERGVH